MTGLRITDPKELERLVKKGLIKKSVIDTAVKAPRKLPKAEAIICPTQPTEPAHVLYRAIVGVYGRLYEGGEAVFELTFPEFKRKYRADVALPSYKLTIELDGWQYHGRTLSGFQRDREKSLEFERRGWRVIRFSNKQIKEEMADVLTALREIISHCTYQPELKKKVKQVAFDRSEFRD